MEPRDRRSPRGLAKSSMLITTIVGPLLVAISLWGLSIMDGIRFDISTVKQSIAEIDKRYKELKNDLADMTGRPHPYANP